MPSGCSATTAAKSAPTIVPSLDDATGALLARNAYSLDYGDRVAFLASDGEAQSVTADRHEFIGRAGSVERPEAVATGAALSGRVEAGSDPCAAMARDVDGAGRRRGRRCCGCLATPARPKRQARWRPRTAARISTNGSPTMTAAGTNSSARCRSRRRTRRSTRWSITGCPTRAWPAASGRAPPSTRRAAPSASATSCRTRWRCCCTIRSWRATRS